MLALSKEKADNLLQITTKVVVGRCCDSWSNSVELKIDSGERSYSRFADLAGAVAESSQQVPTHCGVCALTFAYARRNFAPRRSRNSSITRYNTGIKKRFKMVDIIIPPNTVVPTE